MMWHADVLLASYSAGTLSAVRASSVESHLMACQACRDALAGHVDRGRTEQIWQGITVRLHAPKPTPVEMLLGRLGVPESTTRLLAATPALSLSWLLGVAATLTLAVLAAHAAPTRGTLAFLMFAPVLPVIGVAASYGRDIDPLHELATAAPFDGIRLLLLRAAVVVAASSILNAVAALSLPVHGWISAAWLLPALALTTMSLAVGRWFPLHRAAGGLTAAWLTIVVVTSRPFGYPTVSQAGAFSAGGQLTCLVVTIAGALLILHRERQKD